MSFIAALAGLLAREMPKETVFLCHSRSAGRRILVQAGAHRLLMGVRAESPISLAAELCSPLLSGENSPRLLEEDEAVALMLECISSRDGFFTRASPASLPLARELYRACTELARSEIMPAGGSEKLRELQELCGAYRAAKRAENCWDRADLLREAVSLAEQRENKVRIVALPGMILNGLERKLVCALSSGGLKLLEMAEPAEITVPAGLLGGVPATVVSPFAKLRGRARFLRCRGADAEVHGLFRDILAHDQPLDHYGIVCMSGDYVPRVYETARRYGLPIRMATGIPFACSSLHMILHTLRGLPERQFNAEELRSLLLAGCLSGCHRFRFADTLRREGVGWGGRAHYQAMLDRLRNRRRTSPESVPDNETLNAWERWINAVFDAAAPEDQADLGIQRSALGVLLDTCSVADERERAACALAGQLLQRIRGLRKGETILARLLDELEDQNILIGSAAPGCLFCVNASQALYTGRQRLYIVGLSHNCFDGGRESSVLLDEEKEAIMAEMRGAAVSAPGRPLKTRADREREKIWAFCEALLCHEGDFVFSYSCFDIGKLIELSPCAQFTLMCDAAGAKVEDISLLPASPLSAGDRRISALRVATKKPRPLACARPADTLQAGKSWRETMDGYTFSASSMEEALRCPFSFYLRHILRLSPAVIPEPKLNTWLEKNTIGTFCHKVLERYYANLPEDGKKEHLEKIFREEYEALRLESPPAAAYLEDKTKQEMRGMIERAVAWTLDEGRKVLHTELTFGMKDSEQDTVVLKAGSQNFRLKGSIDRVDERKDGSRSIVDYKTGDPRRMEEQREYHLQHYLYTQADYLIQRRAGGKAEPAGQAGYLLLSDEAKFLDSAPENTEQLIAALLESLRMEEDFYAAVPWKPEKGELIPLEDGERVEYARTHCYRFCNFKALCPLFRKGADEP